MRASTTNWFFSTIATCALGAATWGCTFEAAVDVPGNDPPPGTPTGTLTQRWSIGGRFDTRACVTYGVDRLQLLIRDTAGGIVARAFQPCEEMQMSVTLATGSYLGDAWLIDTDGRKVSTTLALKPFRILQNTETFIDTDFPISSLLTGYLRLESSSEALESSSEELIGHENL
jgi:hypothetical protein